MKDPSMVPSAVADHQRKVSSWLVLSRVSGGLVDALFVVPVGKR